MAKFLKKTNFDGGNLGDEHNIGESLKEFVKDKHKKESKKREQKKKSKVDRLKKKHE